MNTTATVCPDTATRLPARTGTAIKLTKGQVIKVINTHGKQVVDTWAYNLVDFQESMSMEHSRASWLKVNPRVGDILITNKRRPILTLIEDTSPGIHDTLIAACDPNRYRQLGVIGKHDNCSENLINAVESLGFVVKDIPSPLNLFMNVPVSSEGYLEFSEPVSAAGDHVSLRAEMDLLIVLSACPQDITSVNGLTPMDIHYTIS